MERERGVTRWEMYSGSHRGLMTINMYAPDSAKNFGEYDKFTQMLKRVMLQGRKAHRDSCQPCCRGKVVASLGGNQTEILPRQDGEREMTL